MIIKAHQKGLTNTHKGYKCATSLPRLFTLAVIPSKRKVIHMPQSPDSLPNLMPAWLKQVRPDDLPEVYQEMATVIGVQATVQLAQTFAGSSVYFPKLERALLSLRNQVIQREFDGANIKQLARRWNLSARHLRHIVNPPRPGRA